MFFNKNLKIGDLVLVSWWEDASGMDPWNIGNLEEIIINKKGNYYKIENCSKYYRYCKIISKKNSIRRLEKHKSIMELKNE